MKNLLWQDRFDLANEARCVNQEKLENLKLSLLEESEGQTILKSLPSHYLIEVTNRCNLRCALCPTQYDDSDMPRGYIDIDLFKSLLAQIKNNAMVLSLQNWGEPLLHPDIIEMIQEASSYNIFTVISSNFSLNLDEQFIEDLLTCGLGVLHVDVDGLDQKIYETYRRRGDLGKVMKNLTAACEIKKRLGDSCKTKIETAMIINKFNESQEFDYIEKMNSLGVDRVKVSKLQISPNEGKDWLPDNKDKQYSNYTEESQDAESCQRLYTQMTINWDGRISPCCLTYDVESDFTKQSENPILATEWNNEFFESARSAFNAKPGKCKTICHKCMNNLGSKDLPHFRNTFAIALRSEL